MMIDLLLQRFHIPVDQAIGKIYRHAGEGAIGAFACTERDMDIETQHNEQLTTNN